MSSPPEGSINISSIILEIQRQFGRPVHLIAFRTNNGNVVREIPGEFPPSYKHNEVFDPAFELSPQDQLVVSLGYRSFGLARTFRITVGQREIVRRARNDADGKKSYVTVQNNIVLILGFSLDPGAVPRGPSPESLPNVLQPIIPSEHLGHDPLPPTTSEDSQLASSTPVTDDILRICPRFRLLIIGNSGVGKTSLVRSVFGVQDVGVSNTSRGKVDINQEFVAQENKLFVVHDSLGLEAAEANHLKIVKQFIEERRKQKDLKDKLHAVWVCIQVPYAKGRVLEAGMEEFLRDRKKILGDIPVVVVLTKLDLLDNTLMMEMRREGAGFRSIEEAQPLLNPKKSDFLKEHCGKPILKAAGNDIRYVSVSTKSGYGLEPTIPHLVRTTTSEIERYIKADRSYTAAPERNAQLYVADMAQRASIEKKVERAIEFGRRWFWTYLLGVTISFSAQSAKEYLLGPHQEIIKVWNFNDPENALLHDRFKEALLGTSDLGIEENLGGQGPLSADSAAPAVSTLIPLINRLRPVDVALPPATFATQPSGPATGRFIAYIVDLIYVLKVLFILAPQGSITPRDVALALEVYKQSTYRYRVHMEIKSFSTGPILPGRLGDVVDKIQTLVRRCISDEDVARLRSQTAAARSRA